MVRALHSGEYASPDTHDDLLKAHEDGEVMIKSFFEERIFSNTVSWEKPVKNNSRRTFLKSHGGTDMVKVQKFIIMS